MDFKFVYKNSWQTLGFSHSDKERKYFFGFKRQV